MADRKGSGEMGLWGRPGSAVYEAQTARGHEWAYAYPQPKFQFSLSDLVVKFPGEREALGLGNTNKHIFGLR